MFHLELTVGSGPGVTEASLGVASWVPAPLGHELLDLGLPLGELLGIQLAVAVSIEKSHDDAGIGGSETAESVAELVVAQVARSVLVNDAPVLAGELVEEVLLGLGHAQVVGGAGTAGGELGRAQSGGTVSIAELPEWLPLGVIDLK